MKKKLSVKSFSCAEWWKNELRILKCKGMHERKLIYFFSLPPQLLQLRSFSRSGGMCCCSHVAKVEQERKKEKSWSSSRWGLELLFLSVIFFVFHLILERRTTQPHRWSSLCNSRQTFLLCSLEKLPSPPQWSWMNNCIFPQNFQSCT